MPKLIETVDAEQAKFDITVQEIKQWWASDKQKHIQRWVSMPMCDLLNTDKLQAVFRREDCLPSRSSPAEICLK